jgi:hypothetical protein
MLLSILTLLSQPVEACVPGQATYIDSLPLADSKEVPVDSVITIEMGQGYLHETPDVVLRNGDQRVAVDVMIHKRTLDLVEEHIVLELTPLDELIPEQEYTIELIDLQSGGLVDISSFVVVEKISEEITESPRISYLEDVFVETSEEEMSECSYENRTDLYFEFYDEELVSNTINIYRVDAQLAYSGEEITEDDIGSRFHTILMAEGYPSLSTKISATSADEEYCFVARYSNSAGQEGPMSKPVCSLDFNYSEWKCGTGMGPLSWFGCSNVTSGSASLLTMIFALFGLVRRRKV